MSDPVDLCTGLTARTTGAGHRVLTLDYTADPKKRDPRFAERMRVAVGDKEWRREFCRDWHSASGLGFYPEFTEIGRERFVFRSPGLINEQPVYRGLDLGYRAPVCIWFQYSPATDRVWVLREFYPRMLAAHPFRDAVLYLSGQAELASVHEQAIGWIDAYANTTDMPKPPWFAPGTAFESLSGPEANRVESIAARDPEEATAARVFAARDLTLSIQAGPVRARSEVLRRLLTLRSDGFPGILIDPACPATIAMLDGGLVYPPDRGQRIGGENPRKDGINDNVHDALTYGLVGVVPSVSPTSGWEGSAGQDRTVAAANRRESQAQAISYYATDRRIDWN